MPIADALIAFGMAGAQATAILMYRTGVVGAQSQPDWL